jgi:hypothetical protein
MIHRGPDRGHDHGPSARYVTATSPASHPNANYALHPSSSLLDHPRVESAYSAPRLESSSSNVSNSTSGDTDITSPEPPNLSAVSQLLASATGQDQALREKQAAHVSTAPTRPRPVTPRIDATMGLSSVIPSPTSPMSVDMPALSHGQKRTASGTMKEGTHNPIHAPGVPRSHHSRTLSTESGLGRASEVSHTHRFRLSRIAHKSLVIRPAQDSSVLRYG